MHDENSRHDKYSSTEFSEKRCKPNSSRVPPPKKQGKLKPYQLYPKKMMKILSSGLGTKDRVTYHSCQAALEACPSLSGHPLALSCTHGHRVHLGVGSMKRIRSWSVLSRSGVLINIGDAFWCLPNPKMRCAKIAGFLCRHSTWVKSECFTYAHHNSARTCQRRSDYISGIFSEPSSLQGPSAQSLPKVP